MSVEAPSALIPRVLRRRRGAPADAEKAAAPSCAAAARADESPAARRDGPPADGRPRRDGGELAELQAAFRVFTDATGVLEREYRALQEHARALGRELDARTRDLAASIERQRCLEAQALRHGRLAAMGEMAATLAHEVRNPLGAMELCVKLLAEELADRPSAQRLTTQIATGITDLNHLVSNILEYTRLPEPRLATVDLDGLIDDALATAAPALGAGVTLTHQRQPGTVWPVDRGLLGRALVNLLRNAGEAMGGTGALRVAVEPALRWARIVVADSGPGIPPGSEEAVFAPFFTTKERGTGLGLAVARAAVAAHGGTLALRPAAAGATFVVTLPAVPAAHDGEDGEQRGDT